PLVVIHTHPATLISCTRYMVGELAPHWKSMGIAVVEVPAPVVVPSAAAALMHVDATRPLPAYTDLARKYDLALNAGVGSIEKRLISRQLVTRHDGYQGPVIVKTNLNYGGMVDYRNARCTAPWRTLSLAIRERLPWYLRASIRDKAYRVFPHPRDVPRCVWYNPSLVVERLLPERDGDAFVIRSWYFFGDQGFVCVNRSSAAVAHATTILSRTVEAEPPPALYRLRDELRFQFGKFDYTIVDGQPCLLDANHTPTLGRLPQWPWFHDQMKRLATGIQKFIA
ncbi:MAG TPA: hypothetical protein VK157_14935, partial [Phycisphaerales bacterium]|nr:hypothetical protein [Phycisphaerales bacterium]